MNNYMEYCLNQYFEKVGWKKELFYSNLCQSSIDILDFLIPNGIQLHLALKPSLNTKKSISLSSLPAVSGSVGFLYTSKEFLVPNNTFILHNSKQEDLYLGYTNSAQRRSLFNNQLKDVTVKRLTELEDIQLVQLVQNKDNNSDKRIYNKLDLTNDRFSREYLAYGHLYLPKPKLEYLFSQQLKPNLQYIISGVSLPQDPDSSHVSLTVQHETKNQCSEYSFTSDNQLIGLRSLFRLPTPSNKPQYLVGGELYYATMTKAGGISLGLLRRDNGRSPNDFTILCNPVMGHLALAYTGMLTSQLTTSTRYIYNFNSLESDYAMGLEWRNKSRGLIKFRFSMTKGMAILFNGSYRQLHFSLAFSLPLWSTQVEKFNLESNRFDPKTFGIQLQYFS